MPIGAPPPPASSQPTQAAPGSGDATPQYVIVVPGGPPITDSLLVGANAPTQLPPAPLVEGVVIQALAGNSGIVKVGTSQAKQPFELQPGQAFGPSGITDLGQLWITGAAGDGVCWWGS